MARQEIFRRKVAESGDIVRVGRVALEPIEPQPQAAPALIGFSTSVTFGENSVNAAPQIIDSDVTFTDAEGDFNGGTLTLSGLLSEDRAGIRNEGTGAGQIGVSGSDLSFGGTVIGAFTGGVGNTLTITLNAAATSAAIDALIQNLTYANVSETPTASRTLTLTVTDASGASIVGGAATYAELTGAANPFDAINTQSAAGEPDPAFGDVDNDGDLDLVVGASAGTILYYQNNGGLFTQVTGAANPLPTRVQTAAGGNSFSASPEFFDYDGDGDQDLVVGNFSGQVVLYRNNGAGNAYTQVTGAANPFVGISGGNSANPAFGDIDGDGDKDLLVGRDNGSLRLYTNVGGVFTEQTGAANPFDGLDFQSQSAPAFTDLDGDGDQDVVVGSQQDGGGPQPIRSYINNGNGTFTELTGAANPFTGIIAEDGRPIFADYDNDGDRDFVLGINDTGTIRAFQAAAPTGQSITINVTAQNDAPVVTITPTGQFAPVGAETQVNTFTTGDQSFPVVAALSGGGYVVTWTSAEQDGSGFGIYAQRYDANGAARGAETRVNTIVTNDERAPSVVGLAGGGYVITWQSVDQAGNSGIYAQRFDATGTAQGAETQVHTYTGPGGVHVQEDPAVAALANGGYVVVWESFNQDGSENGVYAQRYDANGNPQGSETQINSFTGDRQQDAAVAALAGGGYVVTWSSKSQDSGGYGVFAQRFDANGVAQGAETRINSTQPNDQLYSAVTGLTGGGYVVTWVSFAQDGSRSGVYARRYDANGTAQSGETRVNTFTSNDQTFPSITALSDGGYVVSWASLNQDGSGYGIYAQRFDASGVAQGVETRINSFTTDDQVDPSIVALAGGGYVVAWHSLNQDGGGDGIYAQRFSSNFVAIEQTAISLNGAITIADADAGSASVTATLTVGYGVLTVGTGSSGALVQSGDGTASVIVTGTIAQLNALLNNDASSTITFTANTDTPPADTTLTVSVNDGGNSGGPAETGSANTIIAITAIDDAPVADADSATVAENATVSIDVLDGDTDVDGGPKAVAAINGTAVTVGQSVTLASGATATLNANGTVSYNPNGAYTYLVSAATGAATGAQSQAIDSFSYALNGGSSATVQVTVTGVDGPGDQLRGTSSSDTLTGTGAADLFNLRDGGNDSASGGEGNDGFYFGAAYTAADSVDGGTGSLDQIGLQGDYSAGVLLGSMLGTELVVLLAGNDARFGGQTGTNLIYDIAADAGTIVSNNRLTIQANTLRAGEELIFNGSASLIDFLIYGGAGTDTLTGGSGNDGFFFGQGRFGASDVVNGGAGNGDQLGLQGNFMTTFGAAQMSGVEFLVLLSASDNRFGAGGGTVSYDLTMNDGNVAAGDRLIVSANTLTATEALTFRGFFESNGSLQIFSGAGDDFIGGSQNADDIWGGAGDDFIEGQGGADTLRGGAGNDKFHYLQASHSTSAARDQILDFASGDLIDLTGLAANTGGGGFSFIGSGAQGGARQVQVIQTGNAATVNVFIDGDAVADLVIDIMIVDGHSITATDFAGPVAQDSGPVKTAGLAESGTSEFEDAGDIGLSGLVGPARQYLDIATARDFGGPDLLHATYDLDMLSRSHDLVI